MLQLLLKELLESQSEVAKLLDHGLSDTYDDKQILDFFTTVKERALISNSALALRIADYLQLLNDSKNYDQIDLANIGDLYSELVKVYPDDISFCESAFFFFNDVLGDSQKANAILSVGITEIEERIKRLKNELL